MSTIHYLTPEGIADVMEQQEAKFWFVKDAQGGKSYINKMDNPETTLYDSIGMLLQFLSGITGAVKVVVMKKFDPSESSTNAYDRFTAIVKSSKTVAARSQSYLSAPAPQIQNGSSVSLERYLDLMQQNQTLQLELQSVKNKPTLSGIDKFIDKVVEDPSIVHQMISGFKKPEIAANIAKIDVKEIGNDLQSTLERLKKIDKDLETSLLQLAVIGEASPETFEFFKNSLNQYAPVKTE